MQFKFYLKLLAVLKLKIKPFLLETFKINFTTIKLFFYLKPKLSI